ncbi:MAG: hypothetical protein ABJO65_00315 [Hyphomicrobiales bacterium]
MRDSVERHDTEFLNSLNDPIARELVATAFRSNFSLSPELTEFAEHVIILDANPLTLNAPPILYGGAESLATREFNFRWQGDPVSPGDVFSKTYQSMTSPGFLDCYTDQKPIIETIQCSNAVRLGSRPVDYIRVLVPATNGQGAWFFISYAITPNQDRYPVGSEPIELHRQAHILRSTNLHKPYSLAGVSI